MTSATLNGKRVALTIEAKARLLLKNIVDIGEQGVLAVRSGSDPRIAYAVTHNGKRSTSCACTGCKVYGRTSCAYRQAVDWKLEADRRAAYTETFHIYE